MRRIALPFLLVLGVLAIEAPAQGADRYALANDCWTLVADGGAIAKADGGYAPGGGEPERFFLKPTALGKYMLFGKDSDLLGADGSDVVPFEAPGAETEWTIDVTGGDYTLVNTNVERALVLSGGRLATAAPAEAGRFGFAAADGCTPFPEIETSTTGEPRVNPLPWTEVRGYTDLHLHQMAFEFIGGEAHCGRPWHPYGVASALVDCPDHYLADGNAAVLENVLSNGTPVGSHDPVGWPTFKDWPHHASLTHEQTYWRWMERSWLGGQRLFVNLFVDNAVLCTIYPYKRNPCNEMEGVRIQARRIYELQDYIDAQYGGPGKGFFRIVKNPFQARRVINRGKLAVVLGIEVSNLFDCSEYNDVPECDRAQIDRQLEEVHRLGVRQMELLNKWDSALAGVAGDGGTTGQITNQGNKIETGHYWAMQTCTGEDAEHVHDREQLTAEDPERDALVGNVLRAFLPADFSPLTYPPAPHCNQRGLTTLGAYTIRKMVERGMIFDPDHMSVLARDQAMSVIESLDHSGVVSSHSWSSPDADVRMYAQGGTISPMANSPENWLKEWRRLKALRDPDYYFGMGFGADMNGFAHQGKPRESAAENPLVYPFKSLDGAVTIDKQVSGERVYDLNVDGVAHYGLFPDWVQDIRTIAGEEPVRDLERAAEAYLQMWERAVGVPGERCRPRGGHFTRRGLKDVRVGVRAGKLLRDAGQPVVRKRAWRWCVKDVEKAKVVAAMNRRGRSTLVVSTTPAHQARAIRAGDRAAKLRSRARRAGKGVFVRPAGNGRKFVYGVADGRVTFTGVAARKLARRPGALLRELRRAGVR